MKNNQTENQTSQNNESQAVVPGKKYEPPEIKTYTHDDILDNVPPALACSGTPCGID